MLATDEELRQEQEQDPSLDRLWEETAVDESQVRDPCFRFHG